MTLQAARRRAVARVRAGVGSYAVAEILALVAAFFFALAATLQQKGALGMGEVSLGSPSSFVKLAKQPWWLAGTIALLCGYAFQAVALANGRLAVIQPLLVTTIVFACRSATSSLPRPSTAGRSPGLSSSCSASRSSRWWATRPTATTTPLQ
jgi:hypothetical protein